MGRHKPKKPRRHRPADVSVTVHEITPGNAADTLAKIFPTEKTSDWRPDILGVDKLSLQPGPDGHPLINGHRVTPEMCEAIQADRPDQAEHFVYDDLIAMADALGPPQIDDSLLDLFGAPASGCTGSQLDHRDGSMSCSLGDECVGVALPHRGWGPCARFGPCAYCEGPPVRWDHPRSSDGA